MDRKYGTMDLPKRSEQMKGIYLKDLMSTSHKTLYFKFNTNTDCRTYVRLISNTLHTIIQHNNLASVPAFCYVFCFVCMTLAWPER